MDLDTTENRKKLIDAFPNIDDPNGIFHIESPETSGYNCIAWAMGFRDRWVDYILDAPKKWWPKGVDKNWKPESLIKAFNAVGFEECDNDKCEEGYDKVALYKVYPYDDPLTGQRFSEWGWSHAAKVINNGIYHSKIGGSFDTFHADGNIFSGTSYGEIYQFMRRPVENKEIIERIIREEPKYVIPDNLLSIITKVMY